MAASKEDIRGWLQDGITRGATHVIVCCDGFNYEDYPVYVQPNQEASEVAARIHGSNMQACVEAYDLSMDIESQLEEYRAWHI